MVAVGVFVGAGPRGRSRTFWRAGQSVGFSLRLLVGLCLLYGTVWLLQAIWRAI